MTGELLAHRRQPQDRAAAAAREAGAARRARRARAGASWWTTRRSTRRWRSRPATAPSCTWSPPTRSRRRTWRSAILSRQAGLRPTELLGAIYSLRGSAAVEHLFSRHRRARLDDRRRGRGPGPGEARLRDGARRGRDRAGDEPPVPRRARRPASACGARREVSRSSVSVSSVAVKLAADFLGDLADRRVLVIGAGENAELTARALRDRGVEALFVANRRYDRALGLAQRYGGRAIAFDDAARRAGARRHRRQLDRRAAPDRRPRGARVRGGLADGPAARDDRPRGAARHRAGRARLPGHRAVRHGRPPARGGAQPERPRGRGRGGARDRARGGGPLRRVARLASTWCRPSPRCAAAPTRSWSRCCARTSRAGSRCPRPTASGSPRWPRAVVSRLLHEPTRTLRGAAGEGTSYRYVHALRELFGLEAAAADARRAGRRGHPPRRRPPAPPAVIRLGTRGSALALAQANWVAERLPGEVEIVPITTSGDEPADAASPRASATSRAS